MKYIKISSIVVEHDRKTNVTQQTIDWIPQCTTYLPICSLDVVAVPELEFNTPFITMKTRIEDFNNKSATRIVAIYGKDNVARFIRELESSDSDVVDVTFASIDLADGGELEMYDEYGNGYSYTKIAKRIQELKEEADAAAV